jgi:hypothetical protein
LRVAGHEVLGLDELDAPAVAPAFRERNDNILSKDSIRPCWRLRLLTVQTLKPTA